MSLMNNETFPLAGHQVRRVGFGAMQLPGPGVMGPPRDHDTALAVLRRAVELGINHIDTSEFYGPHVANQLIREALAPYPADLVLVSKVGAHRDEQGGFVPAQFPEQLKADTRENLVTLGIDRLPVMNLRVMPRDEIGEEAYCPFETQLTAMTELVAEGTIEAFGVSNVCTEEARLALDAGAVCVQNAFNLLFRDDQETLELCRERQVAYVPYFPLGSAFDFMPKVTEDPRVQALAEKRGLTPAQIGLAWLLHQGDNVLLIPGTSSIKHLEENTAVRDLELSAEELASLEA